MKKIKSLSIILALLMVICIMPALPASAAQAISVSVNKISLISSYDGSALGTASKNFSEYYMQENTVEGKIFVQLGSATPGLKCNVNANITKGSTTVWKDAAFNTGAGTTFAKKLPKLSAGQYKLTVTITGTGIVKKVHTMNIYVYKQNAYDYVNKLYSNLGYSANKANHAYLLSVGTYNARTCAELAYKNGTVKNNKVESMVAAFYTGLLDRLPDTEGYKYWCSALNSGTMTRDYAFYGFINSPEFATRIKKLGLK